MKSINDIYNELLDGEVKPIVSDIELAVREGIINGDYVVRIENFFNNSEEIINRVFEELNTSAYNTRKDYDNFKDLLITIR